MAEVIAAHIAALGEDCLGDEAGVPRVTGQAGSASLRLRPANEKARRGRRWRPGACGLTVPRDEAAGFPRPGRAGSLVRCRAVASRVRRPGQGRSAARITG